MCFPSSGVAKDIEWELQARAGERRWLYRLHERWKHKVLRSNRVMQGTACGLLSAPTGHRAAWCGGIWIANELVVGAAFGRVALRATAWFLSNY